MRETVMVVPFITVTLQGRSAGPGLGSAQVSLGGSFGLGVFGGHYCGFGVP